MSKKWGQTILFPSCLPFSHLCQLIFFFDINFGFNVGFLFPFYPQTKRNLSGQPGGCPSHFVFRYIAVQPNADPPKDFSDRPEAVPPIWRDEDIMPYRKIGDGPLRQRALLQNGFQMSGKVRLVCPRVKRRSAYRQSIKNPKLGGSAYSRTALKA